jgi:hypothetical protein
MQRVPIWAMARRGVTISVVFEVAMNIESWSGGGGEGEGEGEGRKLKRLSLEVGLLMRTQSTARCDRYSENYALMARIQLRLPMDQNPVGPSS